MFKSKKRVCLLLAAVMTAAVVIEALLAHPHYNMVWNRTPGFDLIIGFAGAWGIIILSKVVMARLLQRGEDYYDNDSRCGHVSSSDGYAGQDGQKSVSGEDGDGNA